MKVGKRIWKKTYGLQLSVCIFTKYIGVLFQWFSGILLENSLVVIGLFAKKLKTITNNKNNNNNKRMENFDWFTWAWT